MTKIQLQYPPAPLNISNYWNDGSYVEVSESQATKVWYGSCWQWSNTSEGYRWINNCDHSAIRLSSGLYESKWGRWPRYRHPADISPYTNSNKRFFKFAPTISGPTLVCSTNTTPFTLVNAGDLPDNAVTWTCSSNLQKYPAGNLTGKSIVFRATGNGTGWIKATFNGIEMQMTVWAGIPAHNPSDNGFSLGVPLIPPYNQLCRNTERTIRAINSSSNESVQKITHYDWNVYSWQSCITGYNNDGAILRREIRLQLNNSAAASQFVVVAPGNACGSALGGNGGDGAGKSMMFYAVSCGYSYSYPNPATNVLNIEIDTEAATLQSATLEQTTSAVKQLKQDKTFDVRLYDGQGNLLRQKKTKGGTVQFNVSSLPVGIYYLHIYDGVNETPEMRQIVVEH